jgi:hypothetical protein
MANVVELPIPKSNSKIPVQTGLFINNEFVPSVDNLDPIRSTPDLLYSTHSDFTHRVYNPSTEEVICTVTAGDFLILLVVSLASLMITTPCPSLRERCRHCGSGSAEGFSRNLGEKHLRLRAF